MLTALRTHYGGFRAAPAVYNGRRMSRFPPLAKKPYILTAGRVWDEAKNIAALAHVAPQLSWPVLVAGEERHPGGGTVHFRGVQRRPGGFKDEAFYNLVMGPPLLAPGSCTLVGGMGLVAPLVRRER